MAINYSHPTQKVEKLVLLKNKRVIFISNSVIPQKDAGGGSVVVYRHLKRLKDAGHQIMIIYISSSPAFNKPFPVEFDYICLNKKNWYPPIRRRTPPLTNIRIYFTLNSLLSQIKFNSEHDILLGVLGEVSNLLMLGIKKRYKTPYYLFYHDDTIFNRYAKLSLLTAKHINKILKAANYIFPVSDSLTGLFKGAGISYVETLYPIPEGYSGPFSKTHNNEHLQLLVAGMVEPIHFSTLKNIGKAAKHTGNQLHCVTDLPAQDKEKLAEGGFITVHSRYATNQQLFNYIIKHINVLVVFYSFDVQHEPRMLTSFPSKFVEYSHLQLPVLIVAPPQSTLGKWAKKNNWLCYVDSNEPGLIEIELQKLKDVKYFEECCLQSSLFAKNEFAPEVIQQQLVKHLQVNERL